MDKFAEIINHAPANVKLQLVANLLNKAATLFELSNCQKESEILTRLLENICKKG